MSSGDQVSLPASELAALREKAAAYDALEALVLQHGDAHIWCDLMLKPTHWQVDAGIGDGFIGQTLAAALAAARKEAPDA